MLLSAVARPFLGWPFVTARGQPWRVPHSPATEPRLKQLPDQPIILQPSLLSLKPPRTSQESLFSRDSFALPCLASLRYLLKKFFDGSPLPLTFAKDFQVAIDTHFSVHQRLRTKNSGPKRQYTSILSASRTIQLAVGLTLRMPYHRHRHATHLPMPRCCNAKLLLPALCSY